MNYFWKTLNGVSKYMLRFSKATEYKTEIGLTYPPEIKSSDSVCFEEKKKKMLRFSFLPKINNSFMLLSIKVNFFSL